MGMQENCDNNHIKKSSQERDSCASSSHKKMNKKRKLFIDRHREKHFPSINRKLVSTQKEIFCFLFRIWQTKII